MVVKCQLRKLLNEEVRSKKLFYKQKFVICIVILEGFSWAYLMWSWRDSVRFQSTLNKVVLQVKIRGESGANLGHGLINSYEELQALKQ